jgi:hypothetical protein
MEVAFKEISKLAPLAVVLGIVGIALAWTLTRHMALGTWLLAAFLLGHGLVHIMFAAPPPADPNSPAADFAFDLGRSWLVTSGLLSAPAVRAIVLVVVTATVVGYALTAMATVGLLVPAGWWSPLLLGSTIASLALMFIGLSATLVLGIAIDIVLLWAVLATVWSPVSTASA